MSKRKAAFLMGLLAVGLGGFHAAGGGMPAHYPIYSFQRTNLPELQETLELIRQGEEGPKTCRNYMDRSYLDRLTDYETGWCAEYLRRNERYRARETATPNGAAGSEGDA